ncbi:type II toxin-antitoxin system RelE/ParE family toxin [Embleya sp. NPDC059237]|uniref:type II toxin-antitoxin system RelE family toxin n=1 Tax=unclassified Embleya TaxID=2699296 RepID=UPI0036D03103
MAESLAIRGMLHGDLLLHPFRVGKPLEEPLRGYYSARVHPYRILYRVDRERRVVHVHRIVHRSDAYRTH